MVRRYDLNTNKGRWIFGGVGCNISRVVGLSLNILKTEIMNRYSTLFLTLVLFVTTVAHSQYALQTGKMQVNAGLGGIGGGGIPIFVGLDYGYDKNISFGGDLSLWSRVRGFDNSVLVLGLTANANYHFVEMLQLDDIFDVYAGVDVGFSSYYGLLGGGHIGGRYYFRKNIAVNLELGLVSAYSVGKVGLSFLLD